MCNFFSAIVAFKNKKLFYDVDLDHHTEIMEKFGIKDDEKECKFVKVEYTPKDGDVFNHDLSNWQLKVDQDFIPEWYDKDKVLPMCEKALKTVISERFIISNKDYPSVKDGRWYAKDSNIKYVKGGTIKYVYGGTIKYVKGGTIESVKGGTIKYVKGGTIKYVYGGTIKYVYGGTISKQTGGMVIYGKKIVVCDKNYTIEYLTSK